MATGPCARSFLRNGPRAKVGKRDGCTGAPAVSQASAISSTFRCLNATKNDEYDEEEDGFWWLIARPKLPRSQ